MRESCEADKKASESWNCGCVAWKDAGVPHWLYFRVGFRPTKMPVIGKPGRAAV